jgi:hypothetical protein
VQQAYSYAIHPEIRTRHFALCNGRSLAVYSVDDPTPLLNLKFEEFESRWSDIERHLSPPYLLEPALRSLKPDFGFAVSRLGVAVGAELIMLGTRLGMFAQVDRTLYTATVNTEFAGQYHCVSFDFSGEKLPHLVSGLPRDMAAQFLDALSRAPFKAYADLAIEVDLRTHLGEPITVRHETFVPLIIDKVLDSRFNPSPIDSADNDIPPHIFRLRDTFKVLTRPSPGDA